MGQGTWPAYSGTALLCGVLLAPDDDAPRLAYADWLAASGQADRAELIRAQIELAQIEAKCPYPPRGGGYRAAGLRARVAVLLEENGRRWADQVVCHLPPRFARGFVERVEMTWDSYLRRIDRIHDRTPVRAVALDFEGADGKRKGLRGLIAHPRLGAFRELELTLPVTDAAAADLARSPRIAGLRRLALRNAGVSPAAMAALCSAHWANELADLEIEARCPCGRTGHPPQQPGTWSGGCRPGRWSGWR